MIGSGGSGQVYLATDTKKKMEVAIKKMILSNQPNKNVVINEIVIMRDSHHPNIVNYLDSFLVSGVLWVVMEFVEGCSLTDMIEMNQDSQSCMSDNIISFISKEILEGLKYLHSKAIIHRDIKVTIFYYPKMDMSK